jgi:hypothetical protein
MKGRKLLHIFAWNRVGLWLAKKQLWGIFWKILHLWNEHALTITTLEFFFKY